MIESSLQQSETVSLPPLRPFGRTVRSVAGYGVATALMLVSPLLVFVPAALFQCAQRNGRRAVYASASIATMLVGLYFAQAAAASSGADKNTAYMLFGYFILSVIVPSLAVIPLVQRAEKFGSVVLFSIATSAIGLGVLELTMRAVASFSPYALQVTKMQQNGAESIERFRAMNGGAEFVATANTVLQYTLAVVPAMILLDLALVFVLSLLMFGRLGAWRSTDAKRPYLFRNFALPDFLLFGFIFGGLTPLVNGPLQKVAANVLTVVIFLYMLQGLAVIRFVLLRAGAGVFGNVLAFSLLAMLAIAGVGLLIVLMAGLFDPFFDFRHSKRKDDFHEGHTD